MKNWKKSPVVFALLTGNLMLLMVVFYGFTPNEPPNVSIGIDKANIFYIGVNNPIMVAVADVPAQAVQLSANGSIDVEEVGNGKYIVKAYRPSNASLTISASGYKEKTFNYRIKRIPDPVLRLGSSDSGPIAAGTFKAQKGLSVWLENFDFDATCSITSYEVTRVAKNEDPLMQINQGAAFTSATQRLINKAKAGDTYYFDKVKAKCPGDLAARTINSLVFRIR